MDAVAHRKFFSLAWNVQKSDRNVSTPGVIATKK
jgi:hypothetical protein